MEPNETNEKLKTPLSQSTVEGLVSCKLCRKTPTSSKYETDGSGRCSTIAYVKCECGNCVTKEADNYHGYGNTGWDIAESKWKQAMLDAESQWNLMNS